MWLINTLILCFFVLPFYIVARFPKSSDGNVKNQFFCGILVRCAVLFLSGFVMFFFGLPGMVGPFSGIFSVYIWFWIADMLFTALEEGITGFKIGKRYWSVLSVQILLFILFIGFVLPFGKVETLRTLGNIQTVAATEDDSLETITDHMLIIPPETARVRAEVKISKLSTRFKVGNGTLQEVKKELMYVFPLEFPGWLKWRRTRETPGYIIVSAEDPDKEVVISKEWKLRYTENACWGYNLNRYLYNNGYKNCYLTEFSFEIDDENMRPYWVVSVLDRAIGMRGWKTRGVVMVDPETGKIEFCAKGREPEWIDRVDPQEVALMNATNWGKYVHGLRNSIFSGTDVIMPTPFGIPGKKDDIWIIFGKDNKKYWFTGMTSDSDDDRALVGYLLSNTKTGETRFIADEGKNETFIIDTIKGALPIKENTVQKCSKPIPYKIYGQKVWVASVFLDTGSLSQIAIVDFYNEQKLALGRTKQDVILNFRKLANSFSDFGVPEENSGITIYGQITYIETIGNARYFTINSETFLAYITPTTEEIAFAVVGDEATVSFANRDSKILDVMFFDLKRLDLKKSKIETKINVNKDSQK